MVGAIWKKDLEVERSDLPPLRGGGRRGKLFIVKSGKLWEISYVACTWGAELPDPSLLFGYVFLYCVASLLICIYFLPLPPHRGCHRRSTDRGPPLLLSGWTPRWPRCVAWRVGGHF